MARSWKTEGVGIAAIALFSTFIRLIPFLVYGGYPLGYDTGFYRRYLIEPFASFPNAPVPGLGSDAFLPRIYLDILRFAHVPTDWALFGGYIACFALLPVLLYIWLKPSLGERGAFVAALLFALSPVLYNAYWYFLLKNAFALCLMLGSYIALERRKLPWAILLSAAVALSHKTSAIVYLLSLGVFFVISPGRRRLAVYSALPCAALFALVNVPLVHQISLALPSAVFLEWHDYLYLSIPFLILVLCGWKGLAQAPRTLITLGIVAFGFTIFHLPFYERIFVYCDVALAALAGCAATYLLSRIDLEDWPRGWLSPAVLCIAVGLLLGALFQQMLELAPLESRDDIQAIAAIGAELPKGAYVLTSADEAPWYEGWTTAHVAAPGLLHDFHNLEEWQAQWDATSSTQGAAFLASFSTPLYVSTLGNLGDLIGLQPSCLVQLSPQLLKSECMK